MPTVAELQTAAKDQGLEYAGLKKAELEALLGTNNVDEYPERPLSEALDPNAKDNHHGYKVNAKGEPVDAD